MDARTKGEITDIINRFRVDVLAEIERVKDDIISELWKDVKK